MLFFVNEDVYELLTTKPCIKIEEKAPHPRQSERLLHNSKVTWVKSKPTNSVRRQEQDVNLFLFRRTILGKRKSTTGEGRFLNRLSFSAFFLTSMGCPSSFYQNET